jgi:hypothetical protein
MAQNLASDYWLVDPENLVRGQLIELDVQLEAEAIFRFSTVISTVLEIMDENPEMLGQETYNELVQAKSIEQILAKLLVGLVPVRGYAIDYKVIKLGEKDWIVHQRILNNLSADDLPPTRSLYIVGVAEQSLFWKDIRRVLFSELRFRVLCRLAQDGIQASWTPVKLTDVLESVVPDLANQINSIGSGALDAMAVGPKQNIEMRQQLMNDALVGYAKLLADHYSRTLTEENLFELSHLSKINCKAFGSQKERRDAFEAISAFVLDCFSLPREPLIVAQYRAVALADAGLHLSGELLPVAAPNNVLPTMDSKECFLDSEIVAIYW